MHEHRDQHTEYRHCHRGGAVYLTVEGVLWLASAGFGAVGQQPLAMLVLMIGGMFIHPLATLLSRLLGLPAAAESNRLAVLATWVALTIPLGLPLVFMATASGHAAMFYPAFAVLVGAHWLPFAYIYGMRSFVAFAGVVVAAGIAFGFVFTGPFAACGFVVGGAHLVFGAVQYVLVGRASRTPGEATV